MSKNFDGSLAETKGRVPENLIEAGSRTEFAATVKEHVEACRYNQALVTIIQNGVTPANQYLGTLEPWKIVKTDPERAKEIVFNAVEPLRTAAILLKPFLPRSAETIYRSFNFAIPWEKVRFEDAATPQPQKDDLRILAQLEGGKVKPLFPRIG
jgi:methionyl-tRNA synthetase